MFKKFTHPWIVVLALSCAVSVSALELSDGVVFGIARSGNVFRLKALSDSFRDQLDPVSPDSFIFLSEQLYDGLVSLDNEFNIVPALAEYWNKSSDGKRYRFELRQGVRFHHGEEVTADDVKFSLERILDADTKSPYYQFFLGRVVGAEDFHSGRTEDVAGFKVVDRYTLEIIWTKPYAMALYLMSMHFCKVLPRTQVLEQGEGFFQKPLGTGPFKFDRWIRDTRLDKVGVRLRRNEQYFENVPQLEAIEFSPLYNLDHFLNKEIDSIPVLSEKLLDSEYQVFLDGSLQPVFLSMSCHIPPLDNPAVRKAIYLGIDKSELIRAIHEVRFSRHLLNGYFPPKLPGFFLADDRNTFNLERAKELLLETGFSEENRIPQLTLLEAYPRQEFSNKFYQELRKQLSRLGIQLKRVYYRSPDSIRRFSTPYLILQSRLMNFPDPEDIIRPLFSSQSPLNVSQFKDTGLDRLLQGAEVEPSWSLRNKIFHKIERILEQETPAIPLYFQQNRIAMQANVDGIEVPPLGLNYLKMKNMKFKE